MEKYCKAFILYVDPLNGLVIIHTTCIDIKEFCIISTQYILRTYSYYFAVTGQPGCF